MRKKENIKIENIGKIEQIFGSAIHVKTLLLFYNNDGFFDDITGLTRVLGKSRVTIRKVITDLLEAGILEELPLKGSKIIRMNKNCPYTNVLFDFLDNIKAIEEEKAENEPIRLMS